MAKEKMILNGVEFDVEVNDGVAVVKPKDENVFKNYLNEHDVTEKEFKKVTKVMQSYVRAAVDTTVEEAKGIFSDKNVKRIETAMPYGLVKSDKIEVFIEREKEVRIPGTDKVVKKPSIKVKVSTQMAHVSKSHIRELRDELEEAITRG